MVKKQFPAVQFGDSIGTQLNFNRLRQLIFMRLVKCTQLALMPLFLILSGCEKTAPKQTMQEMVSKRDYTSLAAEAMKGNLEQTDTKGMRPLDVALELDDIEALEILVYAGARANALIDRLYASKVVQYFFSACKYIQDNEQAKTFSKADTRMRLFSASMIATKNALGGKPVLFESGIRPVISMQGFDWNNGSMNGLLTFNANFQGESVCLIFAGLETQFSDGMEPVIGSVKISTDGKYRIQGIRNAQSATAQNQILIEVYNIVRIDGQKDGTSYQLSDRFLPNTKGVLEAYKLLKPPDS